MIDARGQPAADENVYIAVSANNPDQLVPAPTRWDGVPNRTAVQVRDRDALMAALFSAHHRRLVGLARLLVDDLATAEDVVQDAFIALYNKFPRLRDPDAALPYLQTSVMNGARSTLRRRRTTLRVARDEAHDANADEIGSARNRKQNPTPSAEQTAIRRESRREVTESLATLPGRQREVLVLRYYLDLSEAEIAQTLAISRGSVKRHASRGLTKLSARLEATQ